MRLKLTSSMMTALAAGIVSVSALGVSIYEAYLQREQHRASVLPIVETWTGYSTDSFSVNVANKGIGPARIINVQVKVEGQPVGDWREAFSANLGERAGHFAQSMLTGNVMAPGEAAETLTYVGEDIAAKAWQASTSMSLEVCYCSVFDDCWTYRLTDLVAGVPQTVEVDQCAAPLAHRF